MRLSENSHRGRVRDDCLGSHMRILFASSHERKPSSGVTGSLLQIASRLEQWGHEVELIFAGDVLGLGKHPRINQIVFPSLLAAEVLRSSKRYDVVQISSGDGWIAAFLQKIGSQHLAKVQIMQSHGLEHPYYEYWMEEIKKGYARPLSLRFHAYFRYRLKEVEMAIRFSDHVVCPCRDDLRYIVSHGWCADDKISIVPHGVSKDFFRARNYGRDTHRLLFVGSWLHMHKGTHYLVEAFKNIVSAVPDTRLCIVTGGMPKEEVPKDFPPYLRNQVKVIPYIPYNNIQSCYQENDIFLLPSVFEGFGKVVLEAMATGMPVIMTDRVGARDLVMSPKDAIVVSSCNSEALAETAIELLRDSRLREKIGRAGRETAALYTWDKVVDIRLRLYKSIISLAD